MRRLAQFGFGEILGEADVGLNTPERMAAIRRLITLLGQHVVPPLASVQPAAAKTVAAPPGQRVGAEVHPAFGAVPGVTAA